MIEKRIVRGRGGWARSFFDERGATLRHLNFTVVVAVAAVRMMQVPIDQVIDVVAVGHRLMTAAGAVPVVLGMAAAVVLRSAFRRVRGVDRQPMFFNASVPRVVEMTVVKIIDVPVVPDGGVAAARSVLVIVPGMGGWGGSQSHSSFSATSSLGRATCAGVAVNSSAWASAL